MRPYTTRGLLDSGHRVDKQRVRRRKAWRGRWPTLDRLGIPADLLELWAQVAVRGQLDDYGTFAPWDESTWNRNGSNSPRNQRRTRTFLFPDSSRSIASTGYVRNSRRPTTPTGLASHNNFWNEPTLPAISQKPFAGSRSSPTVWLNPSSVSFCWCGRQAQGTVFTGGCRVTACVI